MEEDFEIKIKDVLQVIEDLQQMGSKAVSLSVDHMVTGQHISTRSRSESYLALSQRGPSKLQHAWRCESGDEVGLAGCVKDMIEHKQADTETKKMAKVVETAPTAVVLTDLDGRIEYVNPCLLKSGGFQDASEVIGRPVFDFTNEEGKNKIKDEVIPALFSQDRWQGELTLRRKDGRTYIAEMICALVRDDFGTPSYFLVNFYDITNRKQAEEALLLDDARLEALVKLNQMDEASMQEITDFALEAGVKLTNSKLGYLAFVDEDEKTLVMHSWSKRAIQECDIDHKKTVYPLDETGLWGEALRQRKAKITNDYSSCHQKRGVPAGHVRILRHMNVPIMDKGKIVIVAGVGNKDEDYNDADVRQLTLLMSGMWKLILRRRTDEELHRRDRLLQGVAQATNHLLSSDPNAIQKALEILGKAADIDRVFIMENSEMGGDEHLLLEWCREDVKADVDDALPREISSNALFWGWHEILASGSTIQGSVSKISSPGREFLERLKVKSFLIAPIFIDGKFSAIIGFNDCRNDRKWVENEVAILQAAAGSIGEAIMRRRAEVALKRTYEELEKRVHERTSWLMKANEALHEEMAKHKKTENELRRAQQAADAASRAKSEFLANMSHEIRTPMNAVIGLTGLLLETDLAPEQRDYVETIHTSGEALLSIINDILDFSKIEEGKMELELQIIDLRKCIETSLDMVAAEAAEKGLDLSYVMDDDLPQTIHADPVRLHQILTNLLSNAVKFTDHGRVTIAAHPGDEPGKIHFIVKDTGIGISQENIGKLFQSFSQLDTSTCRKYGGTGLGLAISSKLVELMGGEIWAKSDLGKGSEFHFTIKSEAILEEEQDRRLVGKKMLVVINDEASLKSLRDHAHEWGMQIYPVVSAREAREIAGNRFDVAVLDIQMPGSEKLRVELQGKLPVILLSTSEQDGASKGTLGKSVKLSGLRAALLEALSRSGRWKKVTSPKADHKDMKILLAEDNPVNRKVALLMLKKLGYSADVAANGLEVLQSLKHKDYDVILMDVQMPEMDGLKAAKFINEMNLKRRPAILAMTAYALEGDRERCLNAGMDGYISKPVKIEELRSALEDLQIRPLDQSSGS
ncbi:MAG: hybrid sensory histidine kinase BarA [Methanosaeta sp. PtaB.Bin018]|nr:MAG: hybrid sensory histidine kinase BarA [Methanosaeta sp. PtaB.Bin018]